METLLKASSPVSKAINGNAISFENEIRQQQRLLTRIGLGFGLFGEELDSLVKEVSLYALYHYHETDLSLRMWCSKLMIQKCVFKISREWLQENFHSGNTTVNKRKEIPLSYKTIYLLKNIIGFNESEISLLVNIDMIQVNERLAKVNRLIEAT
jgi:hypothetical protein